MSHPAQTCGALFDWDGVVIDSSSAHERSWERLAEAEGLPLPKDHFKRGFGKKNAVIIPEVYQWATDPIEVQRLGDRKEAFYREILAEEGIVALPGVRALLELLEAHQIPCCIATSTPRKNVTSILGQLGLENTFKGIVSAEDVGKGKPDPEVFLKAAEVLQRPPERCVVFEDAHYGIEAGLAAGCQVVAVATTHPKHELGKAHLAVERLSDLSQQALFGLLDIQTDQAI
jgi:beta-phosphoglucomutase family hydrolase